MMRTLSVWVIGLGLTVTLGVATPKEPKQAEKKLTPEQQAKLKERDQLSKESQQAQQTGKLKEAVDSAEKMLVIEREVYGKDNPKVADTLGLVAGLYFQLEDWDKARAARQTALDILTAAHGKDDWRVAIARVARANVDLSEKMGPDGRAALRRGLSLITEGDRHRSEGRYAAAEECLLECRSLVGKWLGTSHPAYAAALDALGVLYLNTAEYTKGEPLLRRALEIRQAAYGANSPSHANGLNQLGRIYYATGEYTKAEPLFRQAAELWKSLLGEASHSALIGFGNLATLRSEMGDRDRAEPLLREVLALYERHHGKENQFYATYLNNLGLLYKAAGEYAKAEPVLKDSLGIRERVFGKVHHNTADSLSGLGLLYTVIGDHAKAEPPLRQALAVRKKLSGELHPSYADSLQSLATLLAARGDSTAAAAHYRECLQIMLLVLDRTADGQSEPGQLESSGRAQGYLAGYLWVTADTTGESTDVYALVLRWKGQVFLRQRRQRELLATQVDPAAAKISADMLAVTRQLSNLSSQIPKPEDAEAWQQRVADLSTKRETLETDLARRSAGFRKQKEREALTPDQLRKLIPAKTALVDFIVYRHFTPNTKAKGVGTYEDRLAAFVVRPDKEVVRVELGAFKPIRDAIEDWREKWTKRPHPIMGADDPAIVLRDKLWAPIAKRLDGTETVLISPDRELSKLPFGALPGSKDNTYLIEELSIAVLPVPQFLPEQLEPLPKADPSILVLGEVDYGADPGKPIKPDPNATAVAVSRSAVRGERGVKWGALPATREEVVAITDSFRRAFRKGKVEELREGEATEDEVRQQIGKHRWVHFATHGFFAPPSVKALGVGTPGDPPGFNFERDRGAATGHLPGLLSGLVLAGANRPLDPLSDSDDGILTSSEITTLDLRHLELAVLSACETGLGPTAGGEGVLGLQRAFHVAGARTVVASLWQVDDEATRKLMVRTYENGLKGKQTKLGGLIEAQRELLKDGVARGLVKVTEKPKEGVPIRTPPHYWAAFVLSGDWR